MKIKLSKSQWEEAGIKAGWIKTSALAPLDPKLVDTAVKKYVARIMAGEPFEDVLKHEEQPIKRLVSKEISKQLAPKDMGPKLNLNVPKNNPKTIEDIEDIEDDKPRFFIDESTPTSKTNIPNEFEKPRLFIDKSKPVKQTKPDKKTEPYKPRFFTLE